MTKTNAINDSAVSVDPELQMVDGRTLLRHLFPENCRPTTRWLDHQKKARRIPFTKIGHLVFYVPAKVRAALEAKQTVRAASN